MRWLKLTLAYDGTAYAGWQVQSKDRTIQETFERTIHKITGESIRAVASGRTDAGVHALGQVVGLKTETALSNDVLRRALNAELPDDIAVLSIDDVPPGFHAIRDAVRKRYRYHFADGPIPDVFHRAYRWQWHCRLDAEAMHRAGQPLVGRHDFASFQSAGAERESTIRTVSELTVRRGTGERQNEITLDIVADGFLYNMVRAIVGTLIEVGRRGKPESWPAEVLAGCNRKLAGQTAPPQGLFLVQVDYE